MKNLRSRIQMTRAFVEDLCDTPPSLEQIQTAKQITKQIKLVPTLSSWEKEDNGEFYIFSQNLSNLIPPNHGLFEQDEAFALKQVRTMEEANSLKEAISKIDNSDMLKRWVDHSISDGRMTLLTIKPDNEKDEIGFITYRRNVSVDMYNDDTPLNVVCHAISIDYVYVAPHHRNGLATASLIRAVTGDVYEDAAILSELVRKQEFLNFQAPINFRVYADAATEEGEKFAARMVHAIDDIVHEYFTPQEIAEFFNKPKFGSIEMGF